MLIASCLEYRCIVDPSCLLGSLVDIAGGSPIDLGLKLST